jgi:hypothetical protein
MNVSNTAARRRQTVGLDADAQRRPSGANDLCDRAVKIVTRNSVDPAQHAEKPIACWRNMCRRDPDDGASGHQEHDGEIGKRWNSSARDLPGGSTGRSARGRDRRSRSNPLIHELPRPRRDAHVCTCKRNARRLLICRPQCPNRPHHKPKPGCAGRSMESIRC